MQPQIRADQLRTKDNSFTRIIEGHKEARLKLHTTKSKSKISEWSISSQDGNLEFIATNKRGADISKPVVIARDGKHINISTDLIRSSADFYILNGNPSLRLQNTKADSNNKKWNIQAQTDQLIFSASNDSDSNDVPWLRVQRDKTNILSIDFTSVDLTQNETPLVTQESDVFEATVTGLERSLTLEIVYIKSGKHVTLMVPAVAGVSNSTQFVITDIPPHLHLPSTSNTYQVTAVCSATNNGTTTLAWAQLGQNSDQIVIHKQLSDWDDVGIKGIDGFSLTYVV